MSAYSVHFTTARDWGYIGRTTHSPSVENRDIVHTLGPMLGRASQVPALGEDHRDDVRDAVSSLHSFVDLFERVRSARLWRLVVLGILNLADCATTIWFLELGGTEANPAFAPIVRHWWAPLLVKAVIFVVVIRAVWRSPVRNRKADRLLAMAVLYYAAVVAWNLWIVSQL